MIPCHPHWNSELNRPHHDCVGVKDEEKSALPSPPSFKGRRWGKWFSLHSSHQNGHEISQSTQNFILEVMVTFICFICYAGGCCATERLDFIFFTCFYFCVGGRKQIQITRWRFWCKNNKWTDECTRNRYTNWTIPHLFWFNRQGEKRTRGIIPSSPSFKGRKWGKYTFLLMFHFKHIMKRPNQSRISSRS